MSESKQAFIFAGPPGSGKGTLAQLCKQKLGWVQLSTGDLCRKHIAEGTSFGKELDFVIKSGKLVDDTVILEMVTEWIENHLAKAEAIIFDGFPRTLVQGEMFLKLLGEKFAQLSLKVINFEIASEKLVERLSSRRTCENKKCQAIYSVREESGKRPLVDGVCDLCKSPLIQRDDDRAETILKRLEVYKQHAEVLLNFYKRQGLPIEILDCAKPIYEVFEELVALVDKR